jgi:hypothetical protein
MGFLCPETGHSPGRRELALLELEFMNVSEFECKKAVRAGEVRAGRR